MHRLANLWLSPARIPDDQKASRDPALAIARFEESSRRLRVYVIGYRADVGECLDLYYLRFVE